MSFDLCSETGVGPTLTGDVQKKHFKYGYFKNYGQLALLAYLYTVSVLKYGLL